MGSKKVTPPVADIGGDINKYVSGYSQALPGILQFEQQYRPQFLGLNLGDIAGILQGSQGQQGLFGLAGEAAGATQQALQQARAQELGGATGQAAGFRSFAQALSPEAAQQVAMAQQEASRAYQSAGRLSGQEQRQAQQAAREAYGQRGMLGSNASVAAEILNRENILAAKRAEAAQAGTNAYNMAQQFYTAPGSQYLFSAPTSYQSGMGLLSAGLGAVGSATPQLINPDTGVNLGAVERQNALQAQMANAQSRAAKYSAIGSLVGQVGSAVAGGMNFGGGKGFSFGGR